MSESKPSNVPDGSAEEMPVVPQTIAKQRSSKKKGSGRASPLYHTVEAAAAKLSLEPTALRARLRRAQRAEGDTIVADLGGGITAFKFGSSWRIRLPES
ncbi:MAG TPA: hypothetical protein VHW01_27535 [Polyangiaceae bacterium]|jgi:hypothetical protein|nr:hypothetical protein [Polyangiaceae bacterium]